MKCPAAAHSVAQSLQANERDRDDRIRVSQSCKNSMMDMDVVSRNVTYGSR